MREQISTHKPPQFNYNSETYRASSEESGSKGASMTERFISEKEIELMEKIEAIDRLYKDEGFFRVASCDSVSSFSGKSRDFRGSENLGCDEGFSEGRSGNQDGGDIVDSQENLTGEGQSGYGKLGSDDDLRSEAAGIELVDLKEELSVKSEISERSVGAEVEGRLEKISEHYLSENDSDSLASSMQDMSFIGSGLDRVSGDSSANTVMQQVWSEKPIRSVVGGSVKEILNVDAGDWPEIEKVAMSELAPFDPTDSKSITVGPTIDAGPEDNQIPVQLSDDYNTGSRSVSHRPSMVGVGSIDADCKALDPMGQISENFNSQRSARSRAWSLMNRSEPAKARIGQPDKSLGQQSERTDKFSVNSDQIIDSLELEAENGALV